MTKRNRSRRRETERLATPRHPGARQERRGIALPLGLAVVLAVVAYLNALGNGFTLDDVSIVVENPAVRAIDLRSIFTAPYWARGGSVAVASDGTLFRPLTILSFALEYAVWGPSASAFHAMNVALHATVTALVFLLAMDLSLGITAAFVAASIFAVHPVHTEAVTGIVGRAEILATLFFLLSFRMLRRRPGFHPATKRDSLLALARGSAGALCWFAALLSKEVSVTLPLVLAIDDGLHRRQLPASRSAAIRVLVIRYVPLAIVAVAYFMLRRNAIGEVVRLWPGFVGVSELDRVLTASRVLLEYLALFVFPRTLLADYWKTDVPVATSLAEPVLLLSFALWAGVALLLVRFRRHPECPTLLVAWFFITIAPVSNVLFPIGVAKAERLLYLPSVGLCLLTGWATARVPAVVPRNGVRLALAAVLVALTWRTARRNLDWRDNLTLALASLEISASSPLMNDLAAGELVKRGDTSRALLLLRKAVQEAPEMAFLHNHLGAVYHTLSMPDSAIARYREAIRLNPLDAEAHNNLGVVFIDLSRLEEAFAALRAALDLRPDFADAHSNLGIVHLALGRLSEAEAEFAEAVRLNPTSPEAHNNLGLVFARMGRFDRAEAHYRESLRLNPSFGRARANLAALEQLRDSANRRP